MLLFCLFSISEVYQVLSNLWTITCGVGIACISHYNNAKSCILLVQARLTSRPRTQDALVLVGATAALVVLSSSVSAYISVYIAFSVFVPRVYSIVFTSISISNIKRLAWIPIRSLKLLVRVGPNYPCELRKLSSFQVSFFVKPNGIYLSKFRIFTRCFYARVKKFVLDCYFTCVFTTLYLNTYFLKN